MFFIQVENNEHRDEISYSKPPQTEFQKLIRLGKDGMLLCLLPKIF
jgi:hypothetical protein